MVKHRSDAKNMNKKGPLNTEMRRLGAKHFKIILIKYFPCNSRMELDAEIYKVSREELNKRNPYALMAWEAEQREQAKEAEQKQSEPDEPTIPVVV